MSIETYALYVATVLVFFAHPPGPSQILFMTGSMQHGLRRSIPILSGDLSANSLQIAIAGFGLAGVIAISATAFSIVKWAGIVYLVYVGLRMIASARRDGGGQPHPPARAALFRQGFMTSAANPYAVVFFASLFPQFIDAGYPVAPQVAILGATYLVIDGAILIAMGAAAARLFALLGSAFSRWTRLVSGTGLLAAAALLALRAEPEGTR